MPEKVKTEHLKDILSKVAKFKRLEFCPFENVTMCEKSDYKKIVSEIIINAVANVTDEDEAKKNLRNDLNFFSWLLDNKKETNENEDHIESSESVSIEDFNDSVEQMNNKQLILSNINSPDTLLITNKAKPKAMLQLKYTIFK
ncbi:unnamed protein product [Diatraea saccharalis]|uniref:Uncharacterized protein n=1 Tax=Diatraea saccharalis TaxID=40085 RepID=A0A9N9RFE5_9NEOP|nr:unnamed protein product [Diatraea saccharalis]